MIVIDTTPQVIINLFSAILLIITAINENKQHNRYLPQERLFMTLVYTNIFLCLSDAIAWSVEKAPGKLSYILNYIFSSAVFVAIPVLIYIWFLYSLFSIFRDKDLLLKYSRHFKSLIVLSLVLIMNYYTDFSFTWTKIIYITGVRFLSYYVYLLFVVFVNRCYNYI